jgi:anti-sigma28 factor (negative regulator of flagellin synthesis)
MLMKINGGSNGPIRPDAKRDERLPVPDRTDASGKGGARVDSVEISDAGRAKAAQTTAAPDARSARLQAVRERVLRGAYDTDQVVGEVARRILERGDLQVATPSEIQ